MNISNICVLDHPAVHRVVLALILAAVAEDQVPRVQVHRARRVPHHRDHDQGVAALEAMVVVGVLHPHAADAPVIRDDAADPHDAEVDPPDEADPRVDDPPNANAVLSEYQ